jgi:hypothetical protein
MIVSGYSHPSQPTEASAGFKTASLVRHAFLREGHKAKPHIIGRNPTLTQWLLRCVGCVLLASVAYLAWQLPLQAQAEAPTQSLEVPETEEATMFPLLVETRLPLGKDGYAPSGKPDATTHATQDMYRGTKPQWVNHSTKTVHEESNAHTTEDGSVPPQDGKFKSKKKHMRHHEARTNQMVIPEAKPAMKLSSIPLEASSYPSNANTHAQSVRKAGYTSMTVGNFGDTMPASETQEAVFEQDDAWLTNNPTKEASLSHTSSYRPPALKPVYHTTVHDEGGEPIFQRPARPPIMERGYLTLNRPWLPSEMPSNWPGPQSLP